MRLIIETKRPARPQITVTARLGRAMRFIDNAEPGPITIYLRLGLAISGGVRKQSPLSLSVAAKQSQATSSRRNLGLIEFSTPQPIKLGGKRQDYLRLRPRAGRIYFYRSVNPASLSISFMAPAIPAHAKRSELTVSGIQPTPSSSANVTCLPAYVWSFAYRAYGVYVPPNNAYPSGVFVLCRAVLPTARGTSLTSALASYASAHIMPRLPLAVADAPTTGLATPVRIVTSAIRAEAVSAMPQYGFVFPLRVSVSARQASATVQLPGEARVTSVVISTRCNRSEAKEITPGIGRAYFPSVVLRAVTPAVVIKPPANVPAPFIRLLAQVEQWGIWYTTLREAYARTHGILRAIRPQYYVQPPALGQAASCHVSVRVRHPDLKLDLPQAVRPYPVWIHTYAKSVSVLYESWKDVAVYCQTIEITITLRRGRGLGFSRGDEFAYPIEIVKAQASSKR